MVSMRYPTSLGKVSDLKGDQPHVCDAVPGAAQNLRDIAKTLGVAMFWRKRPAVGNRVLVNVQ